MPDALAFTRIERVRRACLRSWRPVIGWSDPQVRREECRLGDEAAADLTERIGFNPGALADPPQPGT